MRILFLDLASHSTVPNEGACIACVSGKKTEAIRFIDHRIGDDGVIPFIEDVLKEAGWQLSDLTHIACVTGPGGFTSLRMAVTLANVYSDQLNIPVGGLHLSELYGARSSFPPPGPPPNPPPGPPGHPPPEEEGSRKDFMWIHATKKTQLFVRGFGAYEDLWNEPTLVSMEELLEKYPPNAPFAGELLPEQRVALASKHPQELPLLPLSDALPGILSGLDYTEDQLLPWYGRGW